MALSDFFPYGAPEQLEGASARMARSTMTASLVVALLVAAAGAMFPRQVTVVIEPSYIPDQFIDPNVILPEPNSPQPVKPAKFTEHEAIPIPVRDEFLDRRDLEPPVLPPTPGGEPNGTEAIVRESGAGIGPLAPPRDPEPGEVVVVDELPAPVRRAPAVYPDLARSAGVEGTVRVLMLVGLNGHVERAIIAPKGSVPMLDTAALDAALTCVFTPALANGHPVKVWVSQSYRFSLH